MLKNTTANRRKTVKSVGDRFLGKIKKTDHCWLWIGGKFSESGYGQFYTREKNWRAHRFAYQLFVGPIPEGLTLDHLCRNKLCVNPSHLEPVTAIENYRRVPKQTVCQRGHERTPGTRRCKICSSKFRPGRLPEARKRLKLLWLEKKRSNGLSA